LYFLELEELDYQYQRVFSTFLLSPFQCFIGAPTPDLTPAITAGGLQILAVLLLSSFFVFVSSYCIRPLRDHGIYTEFLPPPGLG
jgi:hypothetical protein